MRNRKVVANRSAGVARSSEAKPAKITEIISIVTATAMSKRRESMTSAKAPAGKVNNNIDRSGPEIQGGQLGHAEIVRLLEAINGRGPAEFFRLSVQNDATEWVGRKLRFGANIGLRAEVSTPILLP
jgi:hypothetical protein